VFNHILQCYDGSAESRRALKRGPSRRFFLKAKVSVRALLDAHGVVQPIILAACQSERFNCDTGGLHIRNYDAKSYTVRAPGTLKYSLPFIGDLTSSSQAIKDPDFRLRLFERYGDAVGLRMFGDW